MDHFSDLDLLTELWQRMENKLGNEIQKLRNEVQILQQDSRTLMEELKSSLICEVSQSFAKEWGTLREMLADRGVQASGTGVQASGTGVQASGTGVQASCTGVQPGATVHESPSPQIAQPEEYTPAPQSIPGLLRKPPPTLRPKMFPSGGGVAERKNPPAFISDMRKAPPTTKAPPDIDLLDPPCGPPPVKKEGFPVKLPPTSGKKAPPQLPSKRPPPVY
uniref:Uncharacterized protein n=1 Tax=Noctiluca scintillans TaxID=2966 RepID=A0A7S0ZT46_NOCSC